MTHTVAASTRWIARLASIALVAGAGVAHAQSYAHGDIGIAHPYSLATPPGATTGAGYVDELSNGGSVDDRLVAASSSVADRVELHTMSMDGNVMRMRQVPVLVIPAKGHVDLVPGSGYHLMLVGLKRPLKVGDHVPLTLTFANAGKVDVEMQVRERGVSP